jgi:thiamine-phosphate pyrophosphorylase
MLLYYITDRAQFSGGERARCDRLLEKIAEAARWGIEFIQLREKDLSARDLEQLTLEAVRLIRHNGSPGSRQRRTRLLINSRADVAIACGADGVHLPAGDLLPDQVRPTWSRSVAYGKTCPDSQPTVAASCHTLEEIAEAKNHGADLAVFGPVWEKRGAPEIGALGLPLLGQACRSGLPIFALGGVDCENARLCMRAGAAGIAAIRLFQENELAEVVRKLAT